MQKKIKTYPETFEPFFDGSLVVASVLLQILQVHFWDLLLTAETAHDVLLFCLFFLFLFFFFSFLFFSPKRIRTTPALTIAQCFSSGLQDELRLPEDLHTQNKEKAIQ